VLKIIPLLEKDWNLSVIIVFHRKASEETTLAEMLSARTAFNVKEADDKDELVPGNIYLAPPDYHVLIEREQVITLDDSEKVNFSRPSIDVTFESAAQIYGNKLTCILLSGANADGVEGLKIARSRGAFIIVQDPACAEIPYMPKEAVNNVAIDFLLTDQNFEVLKNILNR
jgi:two-component system, chemotaxis family, protein-glutamate methylesterase/glutaminase